MKQDEPRKGKSTGANRGRVRVERKFVNVLCYSVKELTYLSPFSERAVRNMIKRGELKASRVAGKLVVTKYAFDQMLRAKRVVPKEGVRDGGEG